MHILLVLLGCNISYLLNDRINTALNFVGKYNETTVDWFLSGGIKNTSEDIISEAEKMAEQIDKFEKFHSNVSRGNNWNYIYDTKATNTAENFIMVRNFISSINYNYDEIYVITSLFHHNRAKKIAEQILDINYKWILGGAELKDSVYWEDIHIGNLDNDVRKALHKYSML
jgi:hypothetical protein